MVHDTLIKSGDRHRKRDWRQLNRAESGNTRLNLRWTADLMGNYFLKIVVFGKLDRRRNRRLFGRHYFRFHHPFNRRDPRNWSLRKRPRICHGADHFSIDEYRTSTHAGNHSGFFKIAPFQHSNDEVLLREIILEDTKDFHLKLFNLVSFKDGTSYAYHSFLHLGQRHDFGSVKKRGLRQQK